VLAPQNAVDAVVEQLVLAPQKTVDAVAEQLVLAVASPSAEVWEANDEDFLLARLHPFLVGP